MINNLVFTDSLTWSKFYEILQSWKGTPYKHLQSVKGRGADCSLFIANCLIEGGFIKKVPLIVDYYPRDWHVHAKEELVLNSFYGFVVTNLVSTYSIKEFNYKEQKLMRGDLVAFKTSITGVTNHSAIMLDESNFIHCINRKGVVESSLQSKIFLKHNSWKEKLSKTFRLEYVDGI